MPCGKIQRHFDADESSITVRQLVIRDVCRMDACWLKPSDVFGTYAGRLTKKDSKYKKFNFETGKILNDLRSILKRLYCADKINGITTNDVVKIVREFYEISGIINDADSFVLAYAISDNDATHFFAKDRAMKNYSGVFT